MQIDNGAVLFFIFILGIGALNIIIPLLWIFFCCDSCVDDPTHPDSWNYEGDDEIRHIPGESSHWRFGKFNTINLETNPGDVLFVTDDTMVQKSLLKHKTDLNLLNLYSESKSSSSSSESNSKSPGEYSVIGPPNLDHWYYG